MVVIPQIIQKDESHCGPAVTVMLMEAAGGYFTQDQVVDAAGVVDSIAEYGMRIDQIGKAVKNLAPNLSFWYKFRADVSDIQVALRRGYGVGVEWQGLFYEDEDEEKEEEGEDFRDRGHYSIVVNLDEEYQELIFVDPHKEFEGRERLFALPTFLRRWWDTNTWVDPITQEKKTIKDEGGMFIITKNEETFPVDLGCKQDLGEIVNGI